MRCDLHVHSRCSGWVNLPVLRALGRECYSEPRAVYERARQRGMDLVTLTDHDTIEGCLQLQALPGTFVGVELTCELPGGRELHLGVWGLDERQHQRLQGLRSDPEGIFAYLAEQRLPACLNHPFSALTGRRELSDLHLALGRLDLVESLNSMMPDTTNAYGRRAGEETGLRAVGGSDAHTLGSVARAWTEIPGARSAEDFVEGLRRGFSLPRGSSGGYARLTRDVLAVFALGYDENLRLASTSPTHAARALAMLAGLPVLGLIPLVTAWIHWQERAFAARVFRQFYASARPQRRPPAWPARGLSSGLALEAGR